MDGGPWFWHECGVTMFGRFKVYWWWPNGVWWSAGRHWIGGRRQEIKNQTNYAYLKVGPLQFEWWMGA
jgi:hypothetical protein